MKRSLMARVRIPETPTPPASTRAASSPPRLKSAVRPRVVRSGASAIAALCSLVAACVGRISDPSMDASADRALTDAVVDRSIDRSLGDGTIGDVAADVGECGASGARCEGRCVTLADDVNNCGECGRVCAVPRATARCTNGACRVATCETGFGDCNLDPTDGCESWLGSTVNCGRCGNVCDVARPFCDEAQRVCSTGCDVGLARCGALCVDTRASVEHCGGCSRACSFANATARCDAGRCALAACNPGFADCDANASNGCETALGTPTNCARCGDRCDATTPVCDLVARSCTNGCSAPTTRCGGLCVDRASSIDHCGACDNRCLYLNATARCSSGTCSMDACLVGYSDCDRSAANGCEVETARSLSNCGRCGQLCAPANAVAVCSSGLCAYSSCNAGFADCDRNVANGCETSLSTSATHCGACGNTCSPINATARCVGGACSYSACNAGFGDCDRNAANGCETSIASSLTHCGACGRPCVVPHAIAQCAGGRCDYRECLAPYADCDGDRSNGCETDTTSSAQHCGACGTPCAAPRSCLAGICR
ncbi:MAG: hypothetical protein U0269_09880 [Polyangiales bacterium]